MTTNLLCYPRFRGIDATGIALAGGKLYSYAAGTTTPKATYADVDMVAENTNPVVLDVNGEAVVYLDGLYKLVLKASDDTDIWTMDDVSGWGFIGLTDLGVSTFAQTLLDDTSASAILTTLGVSDFIKTLLNDADAATARTTLGAQTLNALLTAISALTPTDGYSIVGNGTTFVTEAKDILKCMTVFISDGGDADSIRIYTTSVHNSGSFDVVASLGKSGSSGEFALNAAGSIITLSDATYITGSSAVLSATIIRNSSTVAMLVSPSVSGDDILFTFTNATTGASIDLTAAFEGVDKVLHFTFLYV